MPRKQFQCKYGCGQLVQWPLQYVQGNPPVNTDDTPHKCPNFNTAGTPFVQKPIVAAPAPIGTRIPDQRVALAHVLPGGCDPNPGKAAGATRDTLYDECLIMLDNIASNVLTIKAKLAEMSKR
jgi:hypothetical protein